MKQLITLCSVVLLSLGVWASEPQDSMLTNLLGGLKVVVSNDKKSESNDSTSNSAKKGLGDLLNGLSNSNKKGNEKSTDSTGSGQESESASSGSGLSNLLGNLVGGLLSTDKLAEKDFVGTWAYQGPAICFQTENFLEKAGGTAAAATLESKVEPYYTRFGLNKLVLTVDEALNFTMQSGKMKAAGAILIENDVVYFQFKALGKVSLGKVKTYVTKSGTSNLSVMFDVTKLVGVIKSVSSMTNNTTLGTVTSLLENYDGICAGFKFQRQ